MMTFGSVCSGIEASQLAFSDLGYKQLWSSEIAEFPSKVLRHHYKDIPNLGDMTGLPALIREKKIEAPDLFCGGTPCQAFSLAGWKTGLEDKRGQLTITFFEIANAIDEVRRSEKKSNSIILWENVEGVLNDRTNAFGNFIAGLAGFDDEIKVDKWPKAGYLEGLTRNVAWRVMDAKYFGLPHQRKRLYVLAGGKDYRPDCVLFELSNKDVSLETKKRKVDRSTVDLFSVPSTDSEIFIKEGSTFEFFREYTDCLYAAYGTKWNGNAAAYNGSLFVVQNGRLRRFTPLECERLMGIPDNYTLINGHSHTNRYQSVGNSWAVPVIKWIGKQIDFYARNKSELIFEWNKYKAGNLFNDKKFNVHLLGDVRLIGPSKYLNTSAVPNNVVNSALIDIVEVDVPEKFYISPQGCAGILRRTQENDLNLNEKLEVVLKRISSQSPTTDEVKSGRPLTRIQFQE